MFESIFNWFHRRSRGRGVMIVGLDVDGGGNGTSKLPPSYTYTVTDLITGATIRTKAVPLRPRPIGRVMPGYIGLAIDLYGHVEIWDACEIAESSTVTAPSLCDSVGFRN